MSSRVLRAPAIICETYEPDTVVKTLQSMELYYVTHSTTTVLLYAPKERILVFLSFDVIPDLEVTNYSMQLQLIKTNGVSYDPNKRLVSVFAQKSVFRLYFTYDDEQYYRLKFKAMWNVIRESTHDYERVS